MDRLRSFVRSPGIVEPTPGFRRIKESSSVLDCLLLAENKSADGRGVSAWTIGCSIPSISHTGVRTAFAPSAIFVGHQVTRLAYLAAA